MFLVGEKIRDILIEKNVKVAELAKLILTSRQNVNGIINRKSID